MTKTFTITTAIDYVNGAPHLGHAYEKITTDIIGACDGISMGSVNLLYTNSRREGARKNYPTLEKRLLGAGFELVDSGEERLTETSKPRDIHYALFHRDPLTRIPANFFVK